MNTNYREELYSISNTLLLNHHNIDSINLFNGKLGIAIFFYKFSKYFENDIYHDYAIDIMKDIFLNFDINHIDFFNLFEIGIGINYLIQSDYIDDDFSSIIKDIKKKLSKWRPKILENNVASYKLPYIGIYILLTTNNNLLNEKKIIDATLEAYENFDYSCISSSGFIDMLLYFLIKISTIKKYNSRSDILFSKIEKEYFCSQHFKKSTEPFLLVKNMLKEGSSSLTKIVNWIENIQIEKDNINTFIKNNLNNLLFYAANENYPVPTNIASSITEKQKSLFDSNMTINEGLAGIGLAMLQAIQNNNNHRHR